MTTVHATRDVRRRNGLPAIARYGAVPLVFLPSIAVYAAVYEAITAAMAGLPVVTAPTAVTVVHAIVGAAFLVAYVAIETGWYRIQRPALRSVSERHAGPASNTDALTGGVR